MIDRRTFATLLAGTVAAPGLTPGVSWGQAAKGKPRREVTDRIMTAIAALSGQEKAGWGEPSEAA